MKTNLIYIHGRGIEFDLLPLIFSPPKKKTNVCSRDYARITRAIIASSVELHGGVG